MAENSLIPVERIERAILLIRGQNVMLDRDRKWKSQIVISNSLIVLCNG